MLDYPCFLFRIPTIRNSQLRVFTVPGIINVIDHGTAIDRITELRCLIQKIGRYLNVSTVIPDEHYSAVSQVLYKFFTRHYHSPRCFLHPRSFQG